MRIPRPSNPGRTKNIIHACQGVIIFLGWAMTIAVWTKGDGIDGRTAWYWALVSSLATTQYLGLMYTYSAGSVSPV